MLFENNDYDFDILSLAGFTFDDPKKRFDYSNNNMNYGNDKILNAKEGFLRGNMFKDEYVPYKNMTYKQLKPSTEREALLYKIMEVDFAVNDLNLYLDLHPEDNAIYEQFKMYVKECIRLKDEYAKKYGPLTLEQVNSNTYEWMKNPWPWDKSGGSMYV